MLPCMVVVVCMFGVICRSEEPTSFIGLLGKTLAKYDTLKFRTVSRVGIELATHIVVEEFFLPTGYHVTNLPFGCVDNKLTIWLC